MTTMKTIPLSNGFSAMVDDEDYEFLSQFTWRAWKPSSRSPLYAGRKYNGMALYMHRVILGDGDYISDHINGDGLDNQRKNLRKADDKQSAWNIRKKKNGTTSKYKGVGWVKKDGAFQARIRTPNGRISLGYFQNEEDAALAYNAKATELHGSFAKLNIIPRSRAAGR